MRALNTNLLDIIKNMASDHLAIFYFSYLLGRFVLSDSALIALPVAATAVCIFDRGRRIRVRHTNVFSKYVAGECDEYQFCEDVDHDEDNVLPSTTEDLKPVGKGAVDTCYWSEAVTEADVQRFVPIQKKEEDDERRHVDLNPDTIEFSPEGFHTEYCLDIDSGELELLTQAHLITSRSLTSFDWSEIEKTLLPGGHGLVTIVCRTGKTQQLSHTQLNAVLAATKLPLLPIKTDLSTVIESVEQQNNLQLAGVSNLNDRFRSHLYGVIESTSNSMGHDCRRMFAISYIFKHLLDTNSIRVYLVAVKKTDDESSDSEDAEDSEIRDSVDADFSEISDSVDADGSEICDSVDTVGADPNETDRDDAEPAHNLDGEQKDEDVERTSEACDESDTAECPQNETEIVDDGGLNFGWVINSGR